MGQKCNLLIKSFIKCKLFCKNYKKRILKNCKEAAINVKILLINKKGLP